RLIEAAAGAVDDKQRRAAAKRGVLDRPARRLRDLAPGRQARARGTDVALIGDKDENGGDERCRQQRNTDYPHVSARFIPLLTKRKISVKEFGGKRAVERTRGLDPRMAGRRTS